MSLSCNPTTLLSQATRYGGLSPRQLQVGKLQLACQLAAGGGFSPPITVSPIITQALATSDGAHVTVSWDTTNPANAGFSVQFWSSADGITYTQDATYPYATGNTGTDYASPAIGAFRRYKCRFTKGTMTPSAYSNVALMSGRVCDWQKRATTAGSVNVDATTQSNQSQFDLALNVLGLDTLMYAASCFVPLDLASAITPLYQAAGNASWTNHNFVAGDLTVNGLLGDGTKYLNTGINPLPTLTAGSSGSLIIYNVTVLNEGKIDMGSQNATGGDAWALYLDFGSLAVGTTYYDAGGNVTGQARCNVLNSSFAGFVAGSRINNARSDIYTANSTTPFSSIANTTGAGYGGSGEAQPIIVFGYNNNSAPTAQSSKRFSFAAIAKGLTSVQMGSLYNAVQTLRTNIGGGFI